MGCRHAWIPRSSIESGTGFAVTPLPLMFCITATFWKLGGTVAMLFKSGAIAGPAKALVVEVVWCVLGWWWPPNSRFAVAGESGPTAGGEGDVVIWDLGDGTSDMLKVPHRSSVRCNTCAASSGRSQFHLRAKTLMMPSVRLPQSQSSAISSRCLMPCVMSRLAVFSGRLSKWIVQAE